MALEAYPSVPLFRYPYTQLTEAQIQAKLAPAAEAGPTSRSPLERDLAGTTLRIVTDGAGTLTWQFGEGNRVTFDGATGGYGALTLDHVTLITHVVPSSTRAWAIAWDRHNNLATVFELWWGGGPAPHTREINRAVWHGYVQGGDGDPPAERHAPTVRMEGRAYAWTEDTGLRTIEYYCSYTYTHWVELDRLKDNRGYSAPADYIQLTEDLYLFARVEAEFSGLLHMYLVDSNRLQSAGVRLGFNGADELEYYMFRGDGKVVGQLAYLEPFDEHGKKPLFEVNAGDQPVAKGARVAYRPVRSFTHMTDEAVHEAALKRTSAFGSADAADVAPQVSMASNNMPFSDILVGKSFTVRLDHGGPVRDYRVNDKFKLQFRDHRDNVWHEVDYRAYEGDTNLAWFSHIIPDSKPRASVQVAVDFTNGLVTSIESHMGTPYYGNETTYRALFGVIEMEGIEAPLYMRHSFTDELVGHAWSWSYSDQMTSMHLYTSPHSMSWTIFTANQTMGSQWCSPCIYVKLRPGVYLFCQNEEACNGAQMIELLNTNISHDCGFSFNGGERGVNLGVVGGIGRHIGKFDIAHFYGPRKREV